LPEKTENSSHSKNSGYKINRGPHNNFSTTNTSNRWKLFSDGRCNFSSHHGTLRPPQNMPIITPSNKNSHPNSNYSAGFYFIFFLDGRCTTLATLHQPLQTMPATIEQASQHHRTPKHKQNLFFFSHRKSRSPCQKKKKEKGLQRYCPYGHYAHKVVLPPKKPSTTQIERKKKLLYHVVVCMNGLDTKGGGY
jgi:hypothetical protein